jgi:hypothetical protein
MRFISNQVLKTSSASLIFSWRIDDEVAVAVGRVLCVLKWWELLGFQCLNLLWVSVGEIFRKSALSHTDSLEALSVSLYYTNYSNIHISSFPDLWGTLSVM